MRQLFLFISFIAACGLSNISLAQKISDINLRDFTACSADDKNSGYTSPCKDTLDDTDIRQALAAAEKQHFVLDVKGDRLLITAKVATDDISYAGRPYLCCDLQAYLDPVADGIYAAKFRWHDMQKSLLELRLMNVGKPSGGNAIYNGSLEFPDPASNIDKSVFKNAGMELTEHSYDISQEFGTRKVTVIKGADCLQTLSACTIIYMADGESLNYMVKSTLLQHKDLRKFVFVGIHNSEDKENTMSIRIDELLFGTNAARYDAFMHFVTETLRQEIESKQPPLARYSAGYSNGSAWALDVLLTKPDLFKGAIAMSPAQWKSRNDTSLAQRRVFIGAGYLEPGFYKNARRIAPELSARGALVQEVYVPSGHSMNTWSNVWSKALQAISEAPVNSK